MISHPLVYLFTLAFMVAVFYSIERKWRPRLFEYLPLVVLIYAASMLLSALNLFAQTPEITAIYSLSKANLLPAMLFLMLLQLDVRAFMRLGRSLLIAYLLAVFSLAFAFIAVVALFALPPDASAAFWALAGSWMGGTANMVAVGSALGVSEEAFAFALVVDSVNYTLWVMILLFVVPFAQAFNRFTKSKENAVALEGIGCACEMGAPRYWSLIALALGVSLLSQILGSFVSVFDATTAAILFATLFGVIGSFSSLRTLSGSSKIATTMLYLLVALIGSSAKLESFDGIGLYVLVGFSILLLHGVLMILGAKIFRLDLFSIGIASLANIGGVASAPILAAAYSKHLVSVGVLMAIMGYLIGTFGGLAVGNILVEISR